MDWVSREDKLPRRGRRVMIFSPCYKKEADRFRLVDGEFVRICTDATHWTYLSGPEKKSKKA
jgi:hypothetical protein